MCLRSNLQHFFKLLLKKVSDREDAVFHNRGYKIFINFEAFSKVLGGISAAELHLLFVAVGFVQGSFIRQSGFSDNTSLFYWKFHRYFGELQHTIVDFRQN